jgi:hypothetical protein
MEFMLQTEEKESRQTTSGPIRMLPRPQKITAKLRIKFNSLPMRNSNPFKRRKLPIFRWITFIRMASFQIAFPMALVT